MAEGSEFEVQDPGEDREGDDAPDQHGFIVYIGVNAR
jgi:hypothetical protein